MKIHRQIYQQCWNKVNKLIRAAKVTDIKETITKNRNNSKQLMATVKKLISPNIETESSRTTEESKSLSNALGDFFIGKVDKIIDEISNASDEVIDALSCDSPFHGDSLDTFKLTDHSEVSELIKAAPCKSCSLDPVPTWLLKECTSLVASAASSIINSSISTNVVPESFKEAIVMPLLKKPNLNPTILQNYRPVSNLPMIR